MTRLLQGLFLALLFLALAAPAKAQSENYNCPEPNVDLNWLLQDALSTPPLHPADYAQFYPWIKNNYPNFAHLDSSMVPNSESVGCMIEYAKKYWGNSKFDADHVDRVINFSRENNWNPSLLLAIWLEETHAGDVSDLEFGCGNVNDFPFFDGQLECLTAANDQGSNYVGLRDYIKLYSFDQFLCSYAGDCSGPPWTNPEFNQMMEYYNFLIRGVTPGQTTTTPPISTNFDFHPLRPNPDDAKATDKLTPYCVMRPLPVELNRFDIRVEYPGQPNITVQTVGNLTQDFTKFITPLLSITDPKKPDYLLPFNEKAQRYLADFLEGRAYYEPQAEAELSLLDTAGKDDLLNRLGVFRKLAPASYQDELKRALIQRAGGGLNNNPYGFDPASTDVHNYIVAYWDKNLQQVVDQGQTRGGSIYPVYLKDFIGNWAPIPKDYPEGGYEEAFTAWKNKDNGIWYKLWPYVPMFTREDALGEITVTDSNGEPYSPGYEEPIEINQSDQKSVDVSHPHLARTYEVSSSLHNMLTPLALQPLTSAPDLANEWIPKLWENNSMWLDPSLQKAHISSITDQPRLELGPLCDVDPNVIIPITSSGDLAYDDIISTNVNRQDLGLTREMINIPESVRGSASADDNANCGAEHDCEFCQPHTFPDGTQGWRINTKNCFVYKRARSNPNYLVSWTPFLNEIAANLISTQSGLFNIFRPAGIEPKDFEIYGWPGQGNAGEESPEYTFEAGSGEDSYAEAGAMQPGDSQSYYYRYLGSIQCAKERVMQVLQPFITGEAYQPYAYECFPELTPETGPMPPPPTGPKWLQWPTKNHTPARTSQCFGAPGDHPHAGLDFVAEPADGAPIYAGAVGKVVKVDVDSVNENGGFGWFVIIKHDNGFSTIYAHLYPDIRVHKDQTVGPDTILGRQDTTGNSTGNHVHFGLAKGSAMSDFYWNGSISDPCAAMENCSCDQ